MLGRSGALPLLSTALAETWERRRDGVLTLAGYLASGGVTGAVARSAEAAYASLSAPGQELARRILVRLAEQDEHGTLRARRLPAAELALVGAAPTVTEEVIETLTARRLLARHDDRLEVTHEALLAAWPRLTAWLADDAVGRSVRRHLAPAAIEWDANGRPDDELYRGTRLEAAAEWAADPDSGPTEVERAFVEASVARAQAELALAQFRANVEAAGRRRIRRLAVVLAAALTLALASAAVAVGYQRTAAERANQARAAGTVADANRLAALSSSARSLDLSLLLAAAAVRTADTPATRDGLLNALVEHRRATEVHQLALEGIQETALSEDGRTLMVVVPGGSPQVLLWHPGEPTPPMAVDNFWPTNIAVSADGSILVASGGDNDGQNGLFTYTGQGDPLRHIGVAKLGGWPLAVTFTPSGELLVLSGARRGWAGIHGSLTEVDPTTGVVTQRGWVGHTRTTDQDIAASFSADGTGLVVSGLDVPVAWYHDLSTGRTTRLAVRERDAASLRFVALPDGVAQLWSDGAITRFGARGRVLQDLDVHRAAVRDVRVLPGGATAVTTGDDGQVVLWDIDRPRDRWLFGESLEGHAGPVVQAEVSSDARSLLTAAADGQVVQWDLTPDAGLLGSSYPGLEGRYVSNRIEVIEPGRLAVAPTRPLSHFARGFTETPGPDTLDVAAVFFDPGSGQVLEEVDVGDTVESVFGSSVSVSPDRQKVSVTTILGATVLDAKTREVLGRVEVPRSGLSDSTWSPDGSRLILASETFLSGAALGRLAVVDPDTWEIERMVPLTVGTPQVLEWSPDGQTLAVGLNFTASVAVLDRELGGERTIELGPGGDVFDLSFSPDGRYLAAGRTGGVLTVLDTRTWKPL
ncbi:MAG TPA: WD40 repeat domain-containing protein, partial [Intrasporangium sp.]|nr:WD40 repeat domain-containing protein [Intrasporangium sp.]